MSLELSQNFTTHSVPFDSKSMHFKREFCDGELSGTVYSFPFANPPYSMVEVEQSANDPHIEWHNPRERALAHVTYAARELISKVLERVTVNTPDSTLV